MYLKYLISLGKMQMFGVLILYLPEMKTIEHCYLKNLLIVCIGRGNCTVIIDNSLTS